MNQKTYIGSIYAIPIALLLLLSFQYPFSVSVPIGGDAPSHVSTATSLSKIVSSTYPLSSLLFSTTRLIPTTWLQRFNLFMAIGYALSGITIVFVLRKIANNLAAIIGLIFWSVSTWDVLPFYRDGTMAQLWSIPFLLVLFYAIWTKRKILFFTMLPCVYFAHPATFAIVALSLALILPFYFLRNIKHGNYLTIITTLAMSCGIISIFLLFPTHLPFASTYEYVRYLSLRDFLETRVGVLFFAAPIGLLLFLSTKNLGAKQIFMSTFAVLSFFTTFNSLLGIGAWERRFVPYFVISLIIFGSIGLANILQNTFRFKSIQFVIILLLIATLGSHAWFSAQGYYKIYRGEKSSLHDDEIIAYKWIEANLPIDSVIIQTTKRGRGIEWLQSFTSRKSFIPAYAYNGLKLFDSCQTILTELPKNTTGRHYALFHTWTEQIPESYSDNPNIFPLVYKNAEVGIYQTPTLEQITPNLINQCKQ